jgi:hypothetical protein
MAGRGPAPKNDRVRRADPERGEAAAVDGVGWQHGDVPVPPDGLKDASLATWATWMGSWFAAFWSPEDVPGLHIVILLFDQVQRGEYQRATELRLAMDTYGITPKGQQDRRWKKPEAPKASRSGGDGGTPSGRYAHLKAV